MTEEIRDQKDAFRPDSEHWGSLIGPVAVVIPRVEVAADEKYMDDFESG